MWAIIGQIVSDNMPMAVSATYYVNEVTRLADYCLYTFVNKTALHLNNVHAINKFLYVKPTPTSGVTSYVLAYRCQWVTSLLVNLPLPLCDVIARLCRPRA